MKKKELLKGIIKTFQTTQFPNVIERETSIPLDTGKIISVIGARRAGKTYLLYVTIKKLIKRGINKESIVYINFEDERLADFSLADYDLIFHAYQELYPEKDLQSVYFFFDEIQNVSRWGKFVRRVNDSISRHVFVTGSNAKVLSSDIATELRGRTIPIEIWPLSFREFLQFTNMPFESYTYKQKAKLAKALRIYLIHGGFPEIVFLDKMLKTTVLQEYFNVMIYNDLVERYAVSNVSAIKFFVRQLIQSHASTFSVNKIYNTFKSMGLSISKNTLYEHFSYIEDMYLVKTLNKYSFAIRSQEQALKKLYCIDNGLFNAVTFSVDQDWGKLLESVVFHHLQRKSKQVFFYRDPKGNFECDFLISENSKPKQAIQVSYEMMSEKTKDREIAGLVKTCRFFGLTRGMIVSFDTREEIEIDGVDISTVEAYRFLLGL